VRPLAGGTAWGLRLALLSGIAGTLCEAGLSRLERRSIGRPPYDTTLMAERLAARAGIRLDGDAARTAGAAMRWSYGPAWGLPVMLATRRGPWPLAGLLVGTCIFTFELLSLPRTGATPPVGRWGARFVAADLVNALMYGWVAAMAASLLRRLSATPRRSDDKEGSHGTDGQ
jgi:hypothetical protein